MCNAFVEQTSYWLEDERNRFFSILSAQTARSCFKSRLRRCFRRHKPISYRPMSVRYLCLEQSPGVQATLSAMPWKRTGMSSTSTRPIWMRLQVSPPYIIIRFCNNKRIGEEKPSYDVKDFVG
jgi:hypothetical protein